MLTMQEALASGLDETETQSMKSQSHTSAMPNEGKRDVLEKKPGLFDRVHDPLNATNLSTFNYLIQLKICS